MVLAHLQRSARHVAAVVGDSLTASRRFERLNRTVGAHANGRAALAAMTGGCLATQLGCQQSGGQVEQLAVATRPDADIRRSVFDGAMRSFGDNRGK